MYIPGTQYSIGIIWYKYFEECCVKKKATCNSTRYTVLAVTEEYILRQSRGTYPATTTSSSICVVGTFFQPARLLAFLPEAGKDKPHHWVENLYLSRAA